MIDAGLHGFGRFGLHLLRRWLDRRATSPFRIAAIHDPELPLARAVEIVREDPDVAFDDVEALAACDHLELRPRGEPPIRIGYSHGPLSEIPWLGEPDLALEASGRVDGAAALSTLLGGRTSQIVVASSCEAADQTLVVGFNHAAWSPRSRVVSYGSCTVNAFVPLAAWIDAAWGLVDADFNVVHNMPRHRLTPTLERRDCTLQAWGPRLLPALSPETFHVNYTRVPFPGVSIFDYRFRLARPPGRAAFLAALREAIATPPLRGLYRIDDTALPLGAYLGADENAILVADRLWQRGDQAYLQAFCDTESSAARYCDLVEHIARRLPTRVRDAVLDERATTA